MIKDVVIVGSGPAGYSAAIYAKRAGLNIILLQGLTPKGQLMQTTDVENYPGFSKISGPQLMQNMEDQAKSLNIDSLSEHVKDINFNIYPYKITSLSGAVYEAKTIIIATGSNAKWLGLEDETTFKGFGVSACATCDGFFFKNQTVAVIGGGNTAATEALHLSHIAKKVYIVHRRETLRCEQVLTERLHNTKNIEFLWNSELKSIKGTQNPKQITAMIIKNNKFNNEQTIDVNGIFIAIGHTPNTDFLDSNFVLKSQDGYILTKPFSMQVMKNQNEILKGVYVAGDVIKGNFKQAVISAGNGCFAALEAQQFIQNQNNT